MENNAEKMHNVRLYMTHPQCIQAICCGIHVDLCQRTLALPGHPRVLLVVGINGLLFGELEGPDGAQNRGEKPRSLVLIMKRLHLCFNVRHISNIAR